MFESDSFIPAKKELETCVRALKCLQDASSDIDGAESYIGLSSLEDEEVYNARIIMKEIGKLRKQLGKVTDAIRLSAGTELTEVGLYELRHEKHFK